MKREDLINATSEWNFDLLNAFDIEIARIAHEKFHLDTYPNQLEVITAEQMIDAYSSVGMPIGYSHWSFGKQFIDVEKNYKRGHMGLAYEIVINSNPCIAYLMEENTTAMQVLVIAHACYGHNSFFKNNYLFKTWTNADAIVDYLVFARNYIAQCEERYGIDEVEATLDACHTLMNYGVDRYKHPPKLSIHEEKKRQKRREEYLQSTVNELWRTIPHKPAEESSCKSARFLKESQENILYFLEKNAPLLESWQREIVRIVRRIAQYFYPQRQTKVMNEGWATFWHYTIMQELFAEGLLSEKFMLEFLQNHTNVIFQPGFDSPYYSGINPYTLGFNMFQDLRRICENPTDEDKQWFPDIAGTDWLTTLDFAMRNFKDESFIAQYLSPKVIRDLKLFSILDDDEQETLAVSAIHNETGYQKIRQSLSAQYNLGNLEPNIQVYDVHHRGDRCLVLRHEQHDRRDLSDSVDDVLKHLHKLWGFKVQLDTVDNNGKVVSSYQMPKPSKKISDT